MQTIEVFRSTAVNGTVDITPPQPLDTMLFFQVSESSAHVFDVVISVRLAADAPWTALIALDETDLVDATYVGALLWFPHVRVALTNATGADLSFAFAL